MENNYHHFNTNSIQSIRVILRRLILGIALLLFAAVPCARAAGELDALNLNLSVYSSYVMATAVQPDGKMIIAGRFSSVLGVPRSNIARINTDGTLDMSFDPKASGDVYCVAVQADGKVVLGGGFGTLQPNGASIPTLRRYIARVNADGTLDMGFDPNANNYVFGLAVQADGKVLFGGLFTSPGQYIARVNADGTLDSGFYATANNYVSSIAVQGDGKVLLGGFFTSPRQYLMRVNTDGGLDWTFNPSAPNNGVNCVAVQGDGKVLFGGYFTTPRQYLARVNADGTLDGGFDPRPDNGVNGVAVQADGKVLLGGYFTTVQQVSRGRLARVNADGTLDSGFSAAANSDVYSVAVQADGKVLVGGAFTQIQWPGDRNCFARLGNDAALQSLSVPDTAQALWNRGGAGPEVGQVTFELSTNGGASWSPLGAGTRVGTGANWRLTGLSLPASGSLRARGRTAGGNFNGTSGLIEQVTAFSLSTGTPDIAVAQAGALSDGVGSVDFGVVNPGSSTLAKTFTITNPGTASLSGLAISVDGANAGDFTVSPPSSTSVPGATGTATFTVTFTPGATGLRNAAIHISSNVSGSKNPYDIALTGRGNTPPTLTLPPSPLIVEAASYYASVANFSVMASDTEDGALAPNISRASGSTFMVGDTTVYVDATDSAGARASGSFIVRVVDTTAPVVTPPANVAAEATSASGAVVTYAAGSATDAVWLTSLSYSPANGTFFPIGTTTVTITAKDWMNNTGTGTFTVTVRDTTAPVVTVPANVTVEATSAAGALVTYGAGSATDAVGVTSLTYWPTSGTFFPLGTTTVTITARDAANNAGTGAFTVTVRDTTAPVVTPPANVVAEATGASGAVVTYAAASATDTVWLSSLTYSQASGTLFPIGTTTVTATATDWASNTGTGTFTVTVRDTTAPVVAAHADVIAEATSAFGAVVTYGAGSATDAVGVTSLAYSQASGTALPVGTTTVTITARDAANNTGTGTFTVTVRDTTTPVVAAHANVTAEATRAGGAVVNYSPGSATDAVGVTSLTYSQASGTVFPLGTTTVTATAMDAASNAGAGTFNVIVQDTTAPFVTPPASISVPATSSSGALVTFGAASATDAVGVMSVTYSQARNTIFPIGTTAVTITARDGANNVGIGRFTVTVSPLTPVQSWREQFFGTTADTGDAANSADPYGRGVKNLSVFAFLGPDQDPRIARISQLPKMQISGGNLLYSFTQPSGVSGVTYGAEWSATSQDDWQPVSDTGSGSQHIFSVPIGRSTRLFLRLTVTEP